MSDSAAPPKLPNGGGFIVRRREQFADPANERQSRLERLAAVCRVFGHKGFAEGVLGHITVRDPQDPDLIWEIGRAHV